MVCYIRVFRLIVFSLLLWVPSFSASIIRFFFFKCQTINMLYISLFLFLLMSAILFKPVQCHTKKDRTVKIHSKQDLDTIQLFHSRQIKMLNAICSWFKCLAVLHWGGRSIFIELCSGFRNREIWSTKYNGKPWTFLTHIHRNATA